MSWESRLQQKLKVLKARLQRCERELELLSKYTTTVLGESLPLSSTGPCTLATPKEQRELFRPLYSFAKQLATQLNVKSLVVMHRCDDGRCVEMSHLTFGTPSDNGRDAVLKGRTKRGASEARREERRRAAELEAARLRPLVAFGERLLLSNSDEIPAFLRAVDLPSLPWV